MTVFLLFFFLCVCSLLIGVFIYFTFRVTDILLAAHSFVNHDTASSPYIPLHGLASPAIIFIFDNYLPLRQI